MKNADSKKCHNKNEKRKPPLNEKFKNKMH
jgi:hypothetical protein